VLAVLAVMLLCGAARPRPVVVGGEESAIAVVRRALSEESAAEVPDWVRRAWRVLEVEGWPRARLRVDTLSGEKDWELHVDSGPRSRVGSVELRGPDPEIIRIWSEGAGLEPGDVLTSAGFESSLARGLAAVSDSGYPLASVTVVGQDYDEADGEIALTLIVRPGPRARVRHILVEGAVRTRPEVLARLSGLRPGDWVVESRLEAARERLLARPGLVDSVSDVEVLRVPGVSEEVDLRLRVEQDRRSGSFQGALGARQGADGQTELSGSVDLVLRDLFGTARRFRGAWQDDGRGRNRLDLAWLEPMVLGSGFDLSLAVGQRHEDEAYDMVLADAGLLLPSRPGLQLGIKAGIDRTTFRGESGRSRRRNRAGVVLGMQWPRGFGAGPYGLFDTDFQAAFVSDRRKDPDDPDAGSVDVSVRHSLIEADGRVGWAFTGYLALEGRLGWRSTENAPLPLPRSEQWTVGGATTVRGYPEEAFFGERVAFGGVELVVGPARRGQAYLFLDAGWARNTREEAGVNVATEERLLGFGLGVRAPTALGAIDLSLGFADELNFDQGKLHVALVQAF
jgi:outer membrane protein assembly factor BamA